MSSIGSETYVKELGDFLAREIPILANGSNEFKPWTAAVYTALKSHSGLKVWDIYPQDRVGKGEYLCDFTIFEAGYGCRLACESQWNHWTNTHQADLEWAFEKLRGVKSDIKLFVFEADDALLRLILHKYLTTYAQHSIDEAYLWLNWQKASNNFHKSWWKPSQNGKQHDDVRPITF